MPWKTFLGAILGVVAVCALRARTLESQVKLPPIEAPPIEMQFVKIQPGEFLMGCSANDAQCSPDELPQHKVRITKAFEMGKYEVTHNQYLIVNGKMPDPNSPPGLPALAISWNDAQSFLSKLNDRKDGYRYRLPTEAEWEYAARAGSKSAYPGKLDDIAWYNGNARSRSHAIGEREPNAWGLYDMFGNAFEWVQDWYDDDYYLTAPEINPAGPAMGRARVTRGGSWIYEAKYLRVSVRFFNVPTLRYMDQGFRCVREPVG